MEIAPAPVELPATAPETHRPLAEEALALSIEAATARHDPAASGFARRYLRDYPTGRFRLTAHAVLDRQ